MAHVYPYLTVANGPEALAFYEKVFDAQVFLTVMDDGGERLAHARFTIEDAVIMITGDFPELPTGTRPPDLIGGTPVTIRLHLDTRGAIDRIFERCPQFGAEILAAPAVKPWNEYYGRLRDPFGHVWAFGVPLD